MSDDHRAFLGEDGVSGDVIEMVVSVDDELDGELSDDANFAKQGLRGGRVVEGVDDRDAVVTDDEAGIGAGFALGIVDGGVNAVAEIFQSEGERGIRGRRWSLRLERGDGAAEEER